MDSILDAERSWKDFVRDIIDANTSENDYRYIRINPSIRSEPPSIDAIHELPSLRIETREALSVERSKIQNVARLLISSSS